MTNPIPCKPKPRKPIARRKPLSRTSAPAKRYKTLNTRRKFKYESNPLKIYKRKYTDAQVAAHAQEKRRERLANPTEAEQAFMEILLSANYEDHQALSFEREAIFLNGDRFILVDFLARTAGGFTAFECDGGIHDRQIKYDRGRDRWLLARWGIRTIRIKNETVLTRPEEVREIINQIHLTP